MSQQVKVFRELQFDKGEASRSGNITGRPSYRNLKVFYDDFLSEDSVAKFTSATDSPGTATITSPDCLTLTCGTTTNILTVALDLSFYGTYGCGIEVRMRNDDVDELAHFIGFSDTAAKEMPMSYSGTTLTSNATDAAGFILDVDATTDDHYAVSVNDGGDGTVFDSGMAGSDGEWTTYRVEIVPDGTEAHAYFYMNTSGKEINPVADLIAVEASAVKSSIVLCPNFTVVNRGTETGDTLDIDYVKVWGGRY